MLKRIVLGAMVFALAAALMAPAALAGKPDEPATYQVTLVNYSEGQPISPPVFVTHDKHLSVWKPGKAASAEIEAIAEGGDTGPALTAWSALDGVTDVVGLGAPLLPQGVEIEGLMSYTSFTITAQAGDRLSFAGMLVCTNDGFIGVSGVKLPTNGAKTYRVLPWDAGTEFNTEASADIVDGCSAIGPVMLDGDPNGNGGIDEDGKIRRHAKVQGIGDLLDAHSPARPAAYLTIVRLDP
jgi:hypothetical protein